MILRSGSRYVYTQTMQKAPVPAPCLDWSRLSRSRREAHTASCQIFAKGRFWPSPVRSFPLESIWILRPLGFFDRHHTKNIWSNFVLSYCVRTLAYGTWLRSRVNAPCLAWSRFGRSGQKTNTASCVYSAMIEGMRYKVYLLLQGLAGAPSYGYGQSSPCMHRV